MYYRHPWVQHGFIRTVVVVVVPRHGKLWDPYATLALICRCPFISFSFGVSEQEWIACQFNLVGLLRLSCQEDSQKAEPMVVN